MLDNDPDNGKWVWRDIAAMAKHLNTMPLMLRRIDDTAPHEQTPPVAMPAKIELSNRHLGYIFTWYGTALATLALAYFKR